MSDILYAVEEFLLQFLPSEILGIGLMAFIGLVIGVLIACYEGLKTKFDQYKVKVGDKTLKFDKRYLASGVMAIAVTFITVFLVSESAMMDGTESFITAITLGFTEGMVTIKTLNRRIDLFIVRSAKKCGATDEQAQTIADSVEVIEDSEEVRMQKLAQFTEEVLPEERTDTPVAEIKFKTL